jgi:hypothetical protein
LLKTKTYLIRQFSGGRFVWKSFCLLAYFDEKIRRRGAKATFPTLLALNKPSSQNSWFPHFFEIKIKHLKTYFGRWQSQGLSNDATLRPF